MRPGRPASVVERIRELLVVLSRPGRPRAGAAYTPRRFVVFLFGKGWGWGREGQDPGVSGGRVNSGRLSSS